MKYRLIDYDDRQHLIEARSDATAIRAALDIIGRQHGGTYGGGTRRAATVSGTRWIRGWNRSRRYGCATAALEEYDAPYDQRRRAE